MLKKYPSIFILIFIIAGIIFADLGRLPAWFFFASALISVIMGIWTLGQNKKISSLLLFSLAFLFLSGFNFSVRHYDTGINHISNFSGKDNYYRIYGTISDWPDLKIDRTEIKVEVDSLKSGSKTFNVYGGIMIKITDTTTAVQRGDAIELYDRIYPVIGSRSSGEFDYRRYLNMHGIFGTVYLTTLLDVRIDSGNKYGLIKIVDDLRSSIRDCFYSNLSPQAAALAAGFLIGETRDIPPEIYQKFRDSGTLHLLAVSGSNVALVLLFFIFLMRPFPINRNRRTIVLFVVIILFNFLSYGEPSVMRASVMASLVLLGGVVERRYNLNNVIALAAVIILLFDPAQLYDVGFQLSFMIAWSLIFSLPITAKLFDKYKNRYWYRWLLFPFSISLTAQIFSIGIIGLYFGKIPLISPLANLIVVPLVSLAVLFIMTLLIASFILPLFGQMVGSWLNLLLEFIIDVVLKFGSEKIPMLEMSNLQWWQALVYYVLLVAAVYSLINIKLRRIVLITVIGLLNLILIFTVIDHFRDVERFRFNLLTIPGGTATIITDNNNDSVDLVINSINSRDYSIAEKIIMPELERLEIKNIDRIFVLEADYKAIDDLFDLAVSYHSKAIYTIEIMKNSFTDVASHLSIDSSTLQIYSIYESDKQESIAGYSYNNKSLHFEFNNSRVSFSSQLTNNDSTIPSSLKNNYLILTQLYNVKSKAISAWFENGGDRLYCSKVEQSYDSEELEGLRKLIESGQIIDLYESGRTFFFIK